MSLLSQHSSTSYQVHRPIASTSTTLLGPYDASRSSEAKGKRRAVTEDDDDEVANKVEVKVKMVQVWNVQWREPQMRKNKSWERDGFLIVKGIHATLKDESGKFLGSAAVTIPVVSEDELKVGGKECKIDDLISYTEYLRQVSGSSDAGPVGSVKQSLTPARSIPTPAAHRTQPIMPAGGGLAGMMAATRLPMPLHGGGNVTSAGVKRRPSRENEVLIGEDDLEEEAERRPEKKHRATVKRSLSVDRTNVDSTRGPDARLETVEVKKKVETGGKEYLCQYRKYTNKKNATWEGDGLLIVIGKAGMLKDRDTRKTIANGIISSPNALQTDQQLNMSGYTIEIESIFDASTALSVPPARPPPPPLLPLVAASPPQVHTPIASKNFYIPGVTPRAAKPYQNPTGSNSGKRLGKVIGPQPRFDPNKEGAVVMPRPTEEHQQIYNPKGLPIVDIVLDPKLGDRLRDHQKEGVKFMYESVMGMRGEGQGCILADEMGLGKSIQAISLIWTLLKQNPYWGSGTGAIERAMIVCPVTLVKNWTREIRQWLGGDLLRPFIADAGANIKSFCTSRSYNLLIIGYERLRTVIDDVKAVQPPIGLIICDEGHRLKSSDAKISKVLRSLSCRRRVILSGTPIQNDLGEYHSMVDFVNPGLLDTYPTFKKVFENAIVKSRERGASAADKQLGAERSDQLTRLGHAFLLRRTADVIAQYLPPKLEYTVFVAPTPLELSIYQEILDGSAVRALLEGSGTEQLSLLMILRQLCNTPGLLMQQVEQGKGQEILKKPVVDLLKKAGNDPFGLALSGKLLALGTLLEQLRAFKDEKIVVVSNFTLTLNIIERHCRQKRYPVSRLDGSTPQAERVQLVEQFNRGKSSNSFIFLLSSKAGGTGLNITGASRLVLVDSDWNPSTDLQAMARIHREGQRKQCVIYRLLTAGTIDEKIFQRQVTKLGLSGSLMDDGQSRGAGKGDAFTVNDLRNIFTLHRSVACQTHDLLGCKCHLDLDSEAEIDPDEFDHDADDLDDPSSSMQPFDLAGFTQASQLHAAALEAPPRDAMQAREDSKRLSWLNTWAHYNCCDETSLDEVEDRLLRSVVYERVCQAENGSEGATPPGKGTFRLRGGQIGFVFGRKSG